MNLNAIKNILFPVALIGIISLTTYVYFPGLLGGYLLDDIANLKNLAVYSRFDGFEALVRYILSYELELKRPISTLSFLFDSKILSVNAFQFKLTNLIIHLINGILLYVVTNIILNISKRRVNNIKFIAMTSMAIWLLHPFFVSTTLYVIQRMAMLPVTFILLGLYFYTKGRSIRYKDKKQGLFYIVIGMYLCTALSVLSKENGIILPFLILLLENIIIKPSHTYKLNKLKKWIIYLPPILIVIAFAYKTPHFLQSYSQRDFSLQERLLTESRVIIKYLYHLFNPSFMTEGVYADGFKLSTSILSPITTLFSIICILAILIYTVLIKNKHPIICYSILFFFVSHIIESTFIPLEIYFEHRNYLPSLFLFISIPLLLSKHLSRYKLNYIISFVLIVYLSHLTYLRATLWGDETKLLLSTVDEYPNSIRAIEKKVVYLHQNRNTEKAIQLLKSTIKTKKNISLRINLVTFKCLINEVTFNDFNSINAYIDTNKLSKHDASSIAGLLEMLLNKTCSENDFALALDLIANIKNNNGYNIFKIHKLLLSFEIKFMQKIGKTDVAYKKIMEYLTEYYDFNDVIEMTGALIDMKAYNHADKIIRLLDEILLKKQFRYTDRDYKNTVKALEERLKNIDL